MKFKLGFLFLTGFVSVSTLAQTITPPAIEWQLSLGGEAADQLRAVRQTVDGGYLVGGYSNGSTNETKTSAGFGALDYWIVRVAPNGQYLWDRSYGGTNQEYLRAMELDDDGGAILAGHSNSDTSGNKTNALLGTGLLDLGDYWIVKIDADGNKLWDKAYGGTEDEVLFTIRKVSSGGYLLGGFSTSEPGGNKTAELHGQQDFWIVRIDAGGNVVWDRSFGGTNPDILYAIEETSDGGFILGGLSQSDASGNKETESRGADDVWVIKLDEDGNKLWERTLGGTANDGLYSIQEVPGGGYILGGYSASTNSNTKSSTNYGVADFWLVRLDAAGDQVWDKSFGGMADDQMLSLNQTPDGGFLLGGYSYSRATGNKISDNFSANDPALNDFWLIRVDANGNRLWEQTYGGTGFESIHVIEATADAGWILGGVSTSPDNGNKTTAPLGLEDFWLVKLGPDALSFPPRLSAAPQSASQIRTTGFRLMLQGVPDVTYVVEGSEQFSNWTPVSTNTVVNGPVEIIDSGASGDRRMYRARLAD